MKTRRFIPFVLCLLLPCVNVEAQGEKAQEQKVQAPQLQAPLILPAMDTNALSIVATVSTTKYIYGQDLVLDIVFTNNSDKDLNFYLGNPEDFFKIDLVFVAKEKAVPLATSIVNGLSRPGPSQYRMRPNQSLKGRVWLNTMFDLSLKAQYRLKVSKTFSGHRDGSEPFTVATEPIDIEGISGAQRPTWY